MKYRLRNQASRLRTQVMFSGGQPCSSSQTQVSVAVLPAPITTAPAASVSFVSPVGVTSGVPSPTSKGGAKDSGDSDGMYVASTTLRRTRTSVSAPPNTERNRPRPA